MAANATDMQKPRGHNGLDHGCLFQVPNLVSNPHKSQKHPKHISRWSTATDCLVILSANCLKKLSIWKSGCSRPTKSPLSEASCHAGTSIVTYIQYGSKLWKLWKSPSLQRSPKSQTWSSFIRTTLRLWPNGKQAANASKIAQLNLDHRRSKYKPAMGCCLEYRTSIFARTQQVQLTADVTAVPGTSQHPPRDKSGCSWRAVTSGSRGALVSTLETA